MRTHTKLGEEIRTNMMRKPFHAKNIHIHTRTYTLTHTHTYVYRKRFIEIKLYGLISFDHVFGNIIHTLVEDIISWRAREGQGAGGKEENLEREGGQSEGEWGNG